jgi:hypothetical protein
MSIENDLICPIQDLSELNDNDLELLRSINVPIPDFEARRLKILRQTALLDSDEDPAYDRFTRLVCRRFKVRRFMIRLKN